MFPVDFGVSQIKVKVTVTDKAASRGHVLFNKQTLVPVMGWETFLEKEKIPAGH